MYRQAERDRRKQRQKEREKETNRDRDTQREAFAGAEKLKYRNPGGRELAAEADNNVTPFH